MNLRTFDVLDGIVLICWLVFISYWAISAIGVKRKASDAKGRLRWLLMRCLLLVFVIVVFRSLALNAHPTSLTRCLSFTSKRYAS